MSLVVLWFQHAILEHSKTKISIKLSDNFHWKERPTLPTADTQPELNSIQLDVASWVGVIHHKRMLRGNYHLPVDMLMALLTLFDMILFYNRLFSTYPAHVFISIPVKEIIVNTATESWITIIKIHAFLIIS